MNYQLRQGWLRRYWGAVAGAIVICSELAAPAIWNQPTTWVIVGIAGTFTSSSLVVAVLSIPKARRLRKEPVLDQERALDRLLAEVAIRAIQIPTNLSVN